MNAEEFNTILENLNEEERNELTIPALRFCLQNMISQKEQNQANAQQEIEELKNELAHVNGRLERAKEFYLEAKEEAKNAALVAKAKMYEDLQIARDRLFIAAETLSIAGQKQLDNTRQKMTAQDMNAILASIRMVIEELQHCEMWTENDPLPPLQELTVSAKPTRKKNTKKDTEPKAEEEQQPITLSFLEMPTNPASIDETKESHAESEQIM